MKKNDNLMTFLIVLFCAWVLKGALDTALLVQQNSSEVGDK
jgi:hypothetical protein